MAAYSMDLRQRVFRAWGGIAEWTASASRQPRSANGQVRGQPGLGPSVGAAATGDRLDCAEANEVSAPRPLGRLPI
jgi:hypothetical protein